MSLAKSSASPAFPKTTSLLLFLGVATVASATGIRAAEKQNAGEVAPFSTSTDLTWGADGQGGSGDWNSTSINWWDGSNAVRWNGGHARFAGPGGTVTVVSPTVSQITFDSGDYRLIGSSLSPVGSLRFVCNTDGWIDANVILASPFTMSATIHKSGPAALHLGSSLYLAENLIIHEGTVRITYPNLSGVNFQLESEPGVKLILATPFIALAGLSGGQTGGAVRPDEGTATSLTIGDRTSIFEGRLKDAAGGAKLSLTKSRGGSQTLRGVNTHSGPTTITGGQLVLSGDGTFANSPVTVSGSGTLVLDNQEQPVSGRLSVERDLTLIGGELQLTGNPANPVTETIGKLRFSHTSTATIDAAAVQANELVREGHGSLMVQGSGSLEVAALPEGLFLGPGILRNGSHWAVAGPGGEILPFNDYAPTLASAGPEDHVDLAVSETALAESREIASLRAFRSESVLSELNLSDGTELTVGSSGLLLAGGGQLAIQGGSIMSGIEPELPAYVEGTLVIEATVGETSSGTDLIKMGPGRLELHGVNTYTGNTVVADGTLWAIDDDALGSGEEVTFESGSLAVSGPFHSSKTLVIPSGSGELVTAGGLAEFAGIRNDGTFVLSGNGSLQLTEPGLDLGYFSVRGGRLLAFDLDGGSLDLREGRADVSGRLDGLVLSAFSGPVVLAIGGDDPGVLEISNLGDLAPFGIALLLECNLGPAGGDLLRVGQMASFATSRIEVRPLFPEILEAGLQYPLVEFQEPAEQFINGFSLDSDLHDAGWRASFVAEGNLLFLRICATPGMEMDLGEALSAPALTWTTGGAQPWKAEPCSHRSGGHIATSGPVPAGTASWIEATVRGPGILSFDWAKSHFNGESQVFAGEQAVLTRGPSPWGWEEAQIQIAPGEQRVRWVLAADSSSTYSPPEMQLANLHFEPQSFESWVSWNSLAGASAGPDYDATGQGVPNLLRYALGLQPEEPSRNRLPHATLLPATNGSKERFLTLVFERPASLGDVAFSVEKSTNLHGWIPLEGPDIVAVEALPDGFERVTATDPEPIQTGDARFLRLRVSLSP